MRLLVIAMLLLARPPGAAAEPTLTEAQAITAAKAWVRAVRAGNAAALAKLSAVPMFVAVQMDGCKLDTTVQKGQLAKHAACRQLSNPTCRVSISQSGSPTRLQRIRAAYRPVGRTGVVASTIRSTGPDAVAMVAIRPFAPGVAAHPSFRDPGKA